MIRMHPTSNATDSVISRHLFPPQRALFSNKVFPHGCYHDFIGRSLCYLQQSAPILRFRQTSTCQDLSYFHQPLNGNTGYQEGISSYFPFDTPVTGGKRDMLDTFKSKFSNDSKPLSLSDLSPSNGKKIPQPGYANVSSAVSVVTSSTSSTESKKSFSCPQCKYSTDRKNNLKRHVITMHFDCDRKLECCGTIFRSKAKLREHVTLFHKNGYRCLVCARMFCRKALLRRHMAVHSGKKDFHCEFCTYATSHKSNLERHQKVHAKSTRLVYSPKNPLPFERRFSTLHNLTEVDIDNCIPQDDTDNNETPSRNNDNTLQHDDESELMYGEDYIDVSDNCNEDISELNDALVCRHGEGQLNDYHFVSLNVSFREDLLSENKGNLIPLRSVEQDTKERSDHLNISDVINISDYQQLTRTKLPETVDGIRDMDEKENLEISNLENNEKHRKLPRLYGLPYRCANCGDRFESQERFNNHDCESDGTGVREQVENSMSLVALILKQGKTYNRIGNE